MYAFLIFILFLVACGPEQPLSNMNHETLTSDKAMPTAAPTRRPRLFVTAHPAQSEDIILAGDEQEVSIFWLSSSVEPMVLKDFTLTNDGDDQTISSVTVEYRA